MLLMSPWASATLGPPLHAVFRRWNVEDLLGHICLIVAATAIIHHGLARLDDERQSRRLFRRHIALPLSLGAPVSVAVVIVADEGYHPDLFPAHVSTAWFGADWTVLGILPVWLCACLGAIGFAYGSARSWHAKVAWFRDNRPAPPPRNDR
ncbi:hypothetical protein [Candidatus Mycobacterium methanotrophicum]|uniref:Uncharacterized protein n=1 Tax=Candidatus Mycobacterium methanotrophicum TaxID=2943498 RepID=A0ABY4QQ35_9MYCO|nr:hypothetical protein [Candidatus Mycobacterium methanotrophicum]UQX11883.1 hypothetical protein M5I08_05640 [Candidatus Mycobacterium methanotrophicum]